GFARRRKKAQNRAHGGKTSDWKWCGDRGLRDYDEEGQAGTAALQGEDHFVIRGAEAGFFEGGAGGGVLGGGHEAELVEVVGFGPLGGEGEEALGDAAA